MPQKLSYVCGNCEHHDQDRGTGEWICMNRNSDLWGLETGFEDTCLDYEPKED